MIPENSEDFLTEGVGWRFVDLAQLTQEKVNMIVSEA